MKTTRRLFFALWPPTGVAEILYRQAQDLQARWGGRAMRLDTLHLTLAFLGNVADEDVATLVQLMDRLPAEGFQLHLIHFGYWPHNSIVYAGVAPNRGLARLAAAVRSLCAENGFMEEGEDYFPHLTLLRNASPGGDLPDLASLPWGVESFVLVESRPDQHGAHYEVLGRWNLGKSEVSADTMTAS